MHRQKHVKVLLCRRWCLAVASFMARKAEKKIVSTIFESAEKQMIERLWASRLCRVMQKAAAQEPGPAWFMVKVERDDAYYFANFCKPICVGNVRNARTAFLKTLQVRRGSGRLGLQLMGNRFITRSNRHYGKTKMLSHGLSDDKALEEFIELMSTG